MQKLILKQCLLINQFHWDIQTCDDRIEEQCEYKPKYEDEVLLGYQYECESVTIYENCTNDVIKDCSNHIEDINENLDVNPRGFIADEVQLVYPERVVEENGIKKIVYGFDWIFDLWDGFQQHDDRIVELESENELLKASVCKLTDNKEVFC